MKRKWSSALTAAKDTPSIYQIHENNCSNRDTCGKSQNRIYCSSQIDLKQYVIFGEIATAQSEVIENSSLIVLTVDRALSRFGQSVSSVLYWKFQFDTKLKKEDISTRPDLFSRTIKEIFKDGARIVELAIMDELKVEFRLPNRNYKDLEDLMNSIKLRYR